MTDPPAVLDASAVLAWLRQERGFELVDPLIEGGIMSAANWSEVLQKVHQAGRDADTTGAELLALGITVEPVSIDDAAVAAELWNLANDLSLGDRLCLALGKRQGARVVTTEKRFEAAAGPAAIELVLIR